MNTQEMNNTDPTITQLRKELRTTRIFTAISSLLMLCILVGGFVVCSRVQDYVDQVWPLVEELSTVDYTTLNATMVKLEESLNAVDWEKMSEQLAALDIDAINEAIEGLDTAELTAALENLNAASEKLKKLGESFEPLTSLFGQN